MPWRPLLPPRSTTPIVDVYLLHFDRPFGHARHYIGSTESLEDRFESHVTGAGSTLVKHAVNAGVNVTLAQVWKGVPLTEEYRLKNRGGAGRWCPICKQERESNAA